MNKTLIFLACCAVFPALAGDGGGFAGATEYTQIENNIRLGAQYAQQIEQYAKQLQQYQAQIQNMMLNPLSVIGGGTSSLIKNIGGIMSAGESIGGTYASIDSNFSRKFQNPLAGNFAQNFLAWSQSSQDSLGASMRSAGLLRDNFPSDTAALQALFDKTQTSQGNGAALQTLGEMNAMQIQQTQKLQDLIATQNLASSTYMASQNSKEQSKQDIFNASNNFDKAQNYLSTPPPKLETGLVVDYGKIFKTP